MSRILVLGLGNLLLTDDGVGIHALRDFRQKRPHSCLAVEVGTAALSAVHLLEEADKVIAFDAMTAGGKPGTVYVLPSEDVLNEGVRDSLHDLGLRWVLHTMKEPRPEVIVIAAEPERIEFGIGLSPGVKAAIPKMVEAARTIISKWQTPGSAASPLFRDELSDLLSGIQSAP